ncbi:MAG TPA: hypothetical protein VLT87_17445 [Thermoanaerobaculia bacterium]|nr:hypothetical protein [Thermoanaerobaculia bacterium]
MNSLRAHLRVLLGCLALFAALGPPPAAAQPVAVTPVFQVNTYTDGDQIFPVVAANDSGRFVVVWHSTWIYEDRPTQDGDSFGLFAQIFDASGARIGTEFRINQTTAGAQEGPAVAMDEDGGFVVVWRNETPVTFRSRIFGRRFDPTGAPLGDEFAVSDADLPVRDYYPAVALDGEGRFVVAWQRLQNGAPPTDSVHARRFDASGAPLGPSFQVNGDEAGGYPSVVLDAEGGFLVIYQSTGLLARRFDASGEPVGDAVQLEVPARFGAQFPEAAGRPEVGSVAVWQSGLDVFGRRLDPAGNPQGLAFPVSTSSAGDSLVFQQVAVDPTGGFIVLWVKDNVGDNGVFIQRFDASGARQGVETRLDTGSWPAYLGAVATVNANGDFVAVWTSGRHFELDGPDGSGFAILARIFRLPPLGADACLAADGHLACDTLRDGGDSELDLDLAAQPGDLPLAGNLDGDVRDDLCLYRDGLFLCDTAHDGGSPEVTIAFGGAAVDVPLLGDVNGDGKDDACLRRRRRFLCDTAHNGATAEVQILFGRPADIPLLGDVDGDGDDDPCLYRAGRFSCDTVHDGRTAEVVVSFGSGSDVPLLGDVDNDGDDDFCVFTGDRFLCDTAHDGGAAEIEIPFAGPAGTVPVLGNLDGF